MHAVLCGAAHNLRLIFAHLRVLLHAFIEWLQVIITGSESSTPTLAMM